MVNRRIRHLTAIQTANIFGIWLLICFCIIIPGMLHCIGPFKGTGSLRTVHVKVVVDPSFSSTAEWKAIVAALFEKADRVMRECAGITLAVDSMIVWDMENAPSHADLLIGDCLVKEQSRGTCDVIVYFARMGNPPALISAMTLYELGYAYLQQPTTTDPAQIDDKTVYTLVHWLGHMFGAVHCYFNRENITVMNPFVHDGIIMTSKNPETAGGPQFHKGNIMLMQGLSQRPFEEKAWNKSEWPKLKKLYDRVRIAYNPWKIDTDGEITGYENDVFHEGNLLLYESSWASLCGYPDTAIRYIDSLSFLYKAITSECVHEGVVGKTRICAQCGYDAGAVSNWLDQQNFHFGMRRAVIFLRKGDSTAANSSFALVMKNIPDQLAMIKDKYINGYSYYKERYCVRNVPAPEKPEK